MVSDGLSGKWQEWWLGFLILISKKKDKEVEGIYNKALKWRCLVWKKLKIVFESQCLFSFNPLEVWIIQLGTKSKPN